MSARRRYGEPTMVSLTIEEKHALIKDSIHEVLDDIPQEKLTLLTKTIALCIEYR